MATDELVTCYWCQEDTEDPELVGVEFTAGSGPDGRPLYRCARCRPMAIRAVEHPAFSPELVEAVAFSLGADALRHRCDTAEPAAQCIRCQALIEPGTGAGGLCPACAN